jgi:hypothetical protein
MQSKTGRQSQEPLQFVLYQPRQWLYYCTSWQQARSHGTTDWHKMLLLACTRPSADACLITRTGQLSLDITGYIAQLLTRRWDKNLKLFVTKQLISSVARLLGSRVRIPPGAWMSVCCECCVLSGRGLCDGLVTRPEESYRVWCV